MSRNMTKATMWHVGPAKTQISLGIPPVWSESSLCAQWVAKDPRFLHADSKDSWADWADAQADLSLRWMQAHFVGFVMSRFTSSSTWWLHNYIQRITNCMTQVLFFVWWLIVHPLVLHFQILLTGKSINYLRQVCQDRTPTKSREAASTLDMSQGEDTIK